ncbi:MAG: chemotaxis response regulator protein-glutamate methylesterase [Dehalococcoidales bacterium]
MVKVLIVDDSSFARLSITRQLTADPEIDVVGVARNGIEALEKMKALVPNVVTLDIEMPRMDGLQTLSHIMAEQPTPVVMLSSLTGEGTATTIRALELGAVDYYLKSSPASPVEPLGLNDSLVTKVKMAARVSGSKLRMLAHTAKPRRVARTAPPRSPAPPKKTIVIGSSTGGPSALYEVLPNLPANIPASMLVVQHMPPSFTRSLAERLDQLSEVQVREASTGDRLVAGQVLVAPGDYHMAVSPDGRIRLTQDAPVLGLRPAVDITMKSAASVYGADTIGVILTGMGSDGTKGAAAIRSAGGKVTTQDEASCVVYGMPRSVVESGNSDTAVTLPRMAREILRMCEAR